MRHVAGIGLLWLMLLPGVGAGAGANKHDELQALYNALNMLNQQQQAIYQQFQMVQEVRRSSLPAYGPPMLPQFMGPPANYDEVIAAQKSALQRDEDLAQKANQLLDQYKEIEDMKKPLQQRIFSLTLGK